MHGIVLVEFGLLVNLAHQDDDGRCACEERVAGTLVGLPCGDEVRQALLEDLAVDFDFRHDGRLQESLRLTMAELSSTAGVMKMRKVPCCLWAGEDAAANTRDGWSFHGKQVAGGLQGGGQRQKNSGGRVRSRHGAPCRVSVGLVPKWSRKFLWMLA